jgi:hypothetical protein
MIAELEPLVDAFIAVYDAIVANDARRLRSAYNPADYRTRDAARREFSVSYQLVEFGTPGQLSRTNPELFASESAKLRMAFTSAAESIEQLLYSETAALIARATERLSGERNGGKPMIFRDTLVTNLQEFGETLKARNITDLPELNQIADRLNAMLLGVDPQFLRDSKTLRQEIVNGFKDIQAIVDANMIDKPSRRFDLSED